MRAILRRLESGERWWLAELVLRTLGGVALGLCMMAAIAVYRSVGLAPAHPATLAEFGLSGIAVLLWATGWALLVDGPGLFRLVPVPPHHARFRVHKDLGQ